MRPASAQGLECQCHRDLAGGSRPFPRTGCDLNRSGILLRLVPYAHAASGPSRYSWAGLPSGVIRLQCRRNVFLPFRESRWGFEPGSIAKQNSCSLKRGVDATCRGGESGPPSSSRRCPRRPSVLALLQDCRAGAGGRRNVREEFGKRVGHPEGLPVPFGAKHVVDQRDVIQHAPLLARQGVDLVERQAERAVRGSNRLRGAGGRRRRRHGLRGALEVLARQRSACRCPVRVLPDRHFGVVCILLQPSDRGRPFLRRAAAACRLLETGPRVIDGPRTLPRVCQVGLGHPVADGGPAGGTSREHRAGAPKGVPNGPHDSVIRYPTPTKWPFRIIRKTSDCRPVHALERFS